MKPGAVHDECKYVIPVLNMTNEIQKDLLTQAKKQLTSSDFENAAKSARGVLALDEGNSEATAVLKAAEAALTGGNLSSRSDEDSISQSPNEQDEFKSIAARVQALLDSAKATIRSPDPTKTTKNLFRAESLLKEFLEKYPENSNANQILSDVYKAHREANATRERGWNENKTVSTNNRLRSERNIERSITSEREDSSVIKLPHMLGLIIVCVILYFFVLR